MNHVCLLKKLIARIGRLVSSMEGIMRMFVQRLYEHCRCHLLVNDCWLHFEALVVDGF